MDLLEPPRPDLRPPPTPQTTQHRPIWKRGWFWIVVVVVLAVIGTAIEGGEGGDDTSTASQANLPVEDLPIFSGHSGDHVVALVNENGIVSAKVLGELPAICDAFAGHIVKWDKSSRTYQDTGQVATDATGEPATALTATFFGPSVPATRRATSSMPT